MCWQTDHPLPHTQYFMRGRIILPINDSQSKSFPHQTFFVENIRKKSEHVIGPQKCISGKKKLPPLPSKTNYNYRLEFFETKKGGYF